MTITVISEAELALQKEVAALRAELAATQEMPPYGLEPWEVDPWQDRSKKARDGSFHYPVHMQSEIYELREKLELLKTDYAIYRDGACIVHSKHRDEIKALRAELAALQNQEPVGEVRAERRGGKRRKHVPPKFNHAEANEIRALRAEGVSCQALCLKFKCSRSTLYLVLSKRKPYETNV